MITLKIFWSTVYFIFISSFFNFYFCVSQCALYTSTVVHVYNINKYTYIGIAHSEVFYWWGAQSKKFREHRSRWQEASALYWKHTTCIEQFCGLMFLFHSYIPLTATFSTNLCLSISIFLELHKVPDFFQEYLNSWVLEGVAIPNFKKLLSSTRQKKMKT